MYDQNYNLLTIALKELKSHKEQDKMYEAYSIIKQRGIVKTMQDSSLRKVRAAFNNLLQNHKAKKAHQLHKLTFIISILSNSDLIKVLQIYNSLKFRAFQGVASCDIRLQRINKEFVHRIISKGYSLQHYAIRSLKDYLAYTELKKEKVNNFQRGICNRFIRSTVIYLGQAFRMLKVNCNEEISNEKKNILKLKGVINRVQNANTRLLGMGYNKLAESYKHERNNARKRVSFIIQGIKNQDSMFKLMAYNGLKETLWINYQEVLNKKRMKNVLKNLIKAFQLRQTDGLEYFKKLVTWRNQNDKERTKIVKRIASSNYRLMGIVMRQLRQVCKKNAEIDNIKTQVIKRILDTNYRLLSQAWKTLMLFYSQDRNNQDSAVFKMKLVCQKFANTGLSLMAAALKNLRNNNKKVRQNLQAKMKFIIRAIKDSDAKLILMAYNSLNINRRIKLEVDVSDSYERKLKISVINNMRNSAKNL